MTANERTELRARLASALAVGFTIGAQAAYADLGVQPSRAARMILERHRNVQLQVAAERIEELLT